MGDTMTIGGNSVKLKTSSTELNRFLEFRNKYQTGDYKVKFKNRKGDFSLELYKSIRLPLIGKIGYGQCVMSIDISLSQLGFAQSLYLSSFRSDGDFGRENKLNFAEYKAYVMHGFNENATNSPMDLMHACLGFAAETGEVLDAIKKHVFHGKPLDRVNLISEFGDSEWYRAALLSLLDISQADILAANKAKLDSRYPHGRRDLIFRDTKIEYDRMSNVINGSNNHEPQSHQNHKKP